MRNYFNAEVRNLEKTFSLPLSTFGEVGEALEKSGLKLLIVKRR